MKSNFKQKVNELNTKPQHISKWNYYCPTESLLFLLGGIKWKLPPWTFFCKMKMDIIYIIYSYVCIHTYGLMSLNFSLWYPWLHSCYLSFISIQVNEGSCCTTCSNTIRSSKVSSVMTMFSVTFYFFSCWDVYSFFLALFWFFSYKKRKKKEKRFLCKKEDWTNLNSEWNFQK